MLISLFTKYLVYVGTSIILGYTLSFGNISQNYTNIYDIALTDILFYTAS